MVYGISDTQVLTKEKIDETFSDLGKKPDTGEAFEQPLNLCLGDWAGDENVLAKEFRASFQEPPFLRDKDKIAKAYSARLRSVKPIKGAKKLKDKLEDLSFKTLETSAEDEVFIGALSADEVSSESLETRFEEDIEEIIKDRWRYLVMQFGGVFLTEVRPNRCFIGNKTLADMLIRFDKKEKSFRLNLELLDNYLRENSNGKTGKVQVHFSDIMLNPKTKDYDLFSITSGDIKKAGIFLDLARFLERYNKGENIVIPVHLPYYEKWKTSREVLEFGDLSGNGRRDALANAEKVIRYLEKNWPSSCVRLALETGNGESKRDGKVAYALLYKPFHFQTLIEDREDLVTLCEDVGHLNLETAKNNWKDYLADQISEFHVSGNNGKEDLHTVATHKTLKDYAEIMSFLKFYSGNICAEIGKGKLSNEEFVFGVKSLAYTLFTEPTKSDYKNLRKIEKYVKITTGSEINRENLNEERYGKYLQFTQASS